MSVCISAFLTTIVCATSVRLIAGPTKWEGIVAIFFFLLPIVILLFALFLYFSENLLKKYIKPSESVSLLTVKFERYEKIVGFIGYVEVVSGVVYACITSWILIAYEFTFLNAIIFILSFIIFSSGYLLVRNFKIGVYLSMLSQAASVINISTPDFTYYFGNLINFTAGIKFSESTCAINFVSIIFFIILLLNVKRKPNKETVLT